MNQRIKTPSLETAEDVTEFFDAWAVPNQSLEMKVSVYANGTQVMLFEAGRKVATGRGRGLVNAIAAAFEAIAADEACK